jgi:prepilin signal peptidase PulO-like enzyme (type II secretory pathway)
MFAGIFLAYTLGGVRDGLHGWESRGEGGSFIANFPASGPLLLLHLYLLASLWVASAVDIQFKFIPNAVTDVGIAVGLLGSVLYEPLHVHWLGLPPAGTAGMWAGWGAAAGWIITWGLGRVGLWERLSPFPSEEDAPPPPMPRPGSPESTDAGAAESSASAEPTPEQLAAEAAAEAEEARIARRVAGMEFLQVLPPVALAIAAGVMMSDSTWTASAVPAWFRGGGAGLLGLTAGAAVVWITRIIGSAVVGKEAMGLGDVYLMAMVGAFLGWHHAVMAFFLAPFPGLLFVAALKVPAVARALPGASENRQIPFGPSLAIGSVAVMLLFVPLTKLVYDQWAPVLGLPPMPVQMSPMPDAHTGGPPVPPSPYGPPMPPMPQMPPGPSRVPGY